MQKYSTSERLACELVGLSRAAYRYMPLLRDDEGPLRAEVIRMAGTYGRYDYRSIASMMRSAGWGQATTAKVAAIRSARVNAAIPDSKKFFAVFFPGLNRIYLWSVCSSHQPTSAKVPD